MALTDVNEIHQIIKEVREQPTEWIWDNSCDELVHKSRDIAIQYHEDFVPTTVNNTYNNAFTLYSRYLLTDAVKEWRKFQDV